MNAKGRAALACTVFLALLFVGSSKGYRGLQPGLDFEAKWPQDKAFQANCPFPFLLYRQRPLATVMIKDKVGRLIIPSTPAAP